MKRLKKPLSMLLIVVLMAMVLAPTASAQLRVTRRVSGTQRSTSASMTNGQSARVVAWVQVSDGGPGRIEQTQPTLVSATTIWVPGAPAMIEGHRGWIVT